MYFLFKNIHAKRLLLKTGSQLKQASVLSVPELFWLLILV